ncbi:MAG: saccharopine dehydrogenase C-terminal domain-containing protein [Bacteroidota bacterium]
MSKQILVIGAGKSATALIDYLIAEAKDNDWLVIVADTNLELAASKTGHAAVARAVSIDVQDTTSRNLLVKTADLVISLLPAALHFLVAQDCIKFKKKLLTASYLDDAMRGLQAAIEEKKLLFLCEMGLDPGIDHMSALQLVHRIKKKNGIITSFVSHCGGLVAPESDTNPWHYKISWNPRNVVTAGKAGAVYRQHKKTKKMAYEKLFDPKRLTAVPGLGTLAWYPNRDSLGYIDLYQLQSAETFIRTTLRYPGFCKGWKQIINMGLTSETDFYETDGMSLQTFFTTHLKKYVATGSHTQKASVPRSFTRQLAFLGLHDQETLIGMGRRSALDVLQFALEKKLALDNNDHDMVVMLHEIEYLQEGKKYRVRSHMILKGTDNRHTAMAMTVGLPLGIAAKLILQGKITITGLHIPVIASIYEPVLQALQQHGIVFQENTEVLGKPV